MTKLLWRTTSPASCLVKLLLTFRAEDHGRTRWTSKSLVPHTTAPPYMGREAGISITHVEIKSPTEYDYRNSEDSESKTKSIDLQHDTTFVLDTTRVAAAAAKGEAGGSFPRQSINVTLHGHLVALPCL